jgi:hypothetical protein
LLCCHFLLKHLALLRAFENTSALKVLIRQISNLCELDFWNGTVLNVAHGMIPVGMEFMHVLLQRPARLYPYTLGAPNATATQMLKAVNKTLLVSYTDGTKQSTELLHTLQIVLKQLQDTIAPL